MVTCIMPSDTSDHCAFSASLRISWDRRESKSHCQRRTTEDRFHRRQLLFCLIDGLWICSRDGRPGVLAAANVGVRTSITLPWQDAPREAQGSRHSGGASGLSVTDPRPLRLRLPRHGAHARWGGVTVLTLRDTHDERSGLCGASAVAGETKLGSNSDVPY